MSQQDANPFDQFDDKPPPIVRTQQSAESVNAMLQHEQACQRVCAENLVYAAAWQTRDMDVESAWEALQTMPLSYLDWLYTPDGWAILINGLRRGLGLDGAAPRVTVH